MESFKSYIDLIARFLHDHLVLFGIVTFVLIMIKSVSIAKTDTYKFGKESDGSIQPEGKRKRLKLLFSSFTEIFQHSFFVGVNLILYSLGFCDIFLMSLLILLDTRTIWFPSSFLKKMNFRSFKLFQFTFSLLPYGTTIYALFTVSFFNENPVLKYLFLTVYGFSFIRSMKRINIMQVYIDACVNKDEAFSVLTKSPGTALMAMPIGLLLNVWVLDFYLILGQGFTLLNVKDPINYGYFDSRNRASTIAFNNDSLHQMLAFAVGVTILFVGHFSTYNLFLLSGVLSMWPNLRFSSSKLSKYYTTIVGERHFMRPNVYDNLLMRVLPDYKRDWMSSMYLKKIGFSYTVFFHNQRKLWDKSKGIIDVKDYVKSCNHLVVLFESDDSKVNYVCEYDLIYALNRADVIIDTWICSLKVPTLFGDIQGDNYWFRSRLDIIRRVSDEDYGVLEGTTKVYEDGSNAKSIADGLLVRQNIVNSSSFESLRQNIQLFEHQYKEADHERVKQLTGRGIYELNTLFRQLHESPSIPSRFIDLLNVAECMIRYLVGFLHAERVSDGKLLHDSLPFDTKAIAFGSCTDFLARWKKSDATGETILGARISALLDVVYDDTENVEALVKYIRIMNPGVTAKYSQKPTLLELSWWMVTVRNKTRGHGTPSKVDYGFYVCLEKVVLFMLAECSKLQLSPCYIAEVDGQKWTFHLSSGGYPEPVPMVEELQKGVHFNPLLEDEMIERLTANHRRIVSHIPAGDESLYLYVTDGEQTEWWRCHKHFQVKDAIVHLLNQRDDKKESWISFSTGRIMRPDISEI
jgi:hypothetical protein